MSPLFSIYMNGVLRKVRMRYSRSIKVFKKCAEQNLNEHIRKMDESRLVKRIYKVEEGWKDQEGRGWMLCVCA